MSLRIMGFIFDRPFSIHTFLQGDIGHFAGQCDDFLQKVDLSQYFCCLIQ